MFLRFPNYRQYDQMDCGPTCLKIILKYYGKEYTLEQLRKLSEHNTEGTSLYSLSQAADKLGFNTFSGLMQLDKLNSLSLPCIVYWKNEHFSVVYKVTSKFVYVSDPANGYLKYTFNDFKEGSEFRINTEDQEKGVFLFMEPNSEFKKINTGLINKQQTKHLLFSNYRKYKKQFTRLIIGIITVSLINLFFPFITQSIVDIGIKNNDFSFITIILASQVFLYISQLVIEYIRSWSLTYISLHINMSFISEFLKKVMNLPVSFFDSKKTGDILQRMTDHNRLQHFLTNSVLSIIFSILSIIIYSIVLIFYSVQIYIIFMSGSILGILWLMFFLKKRKEIDYKKFNLFSESQNSIIQILNGINDIKLNGIEVSKKNQWLHIQNKLFTVSVQSFLTGQYQVSGTTLIYHLKNLIVIYLAAKGVMEGQITLGMMLAITYIIGMLNSPIEHLISFAQTAQDARISYERISEIHCLENEDQAVKKHRKTTGDPGKIILDNVSFNYTGRKSGFSINKINAVFNKGETIAIVGNSGGGKTTLMKLMLRLYEPVSGKILIEGNELSGMDHSEWRQKCGVVMQDGYIFDDTIANNISLTNELPEKRKLALSIEIANLDSFLTELPMGYNTRIGMNGYGISQGQKQRILIARAVYKNPEYIFLDEATSSLDSENEKVIHENLKKFYFGKTVFVVAHRLSTVRNSGKIVVLDHGRILETGTHDSLIRSKNVYYRLIQNQLQLTS